MVGYFFFGRAVQVTMTVQEQANVEGLFCTHPHKTYVTQKLYAAYVEWKKKFWFANTQ